MALAKDEGSSHENLSLGQAPVLSTPEHYNFRDLSFRPKKSFDVRDRKQANNENLWQKYEIKRTAKEILAGGWKRVALQCPDDMLDDAWVLVSSLEAELKQQGNICRESYPMKEALMASGSKKIAPGQTRINPRIDESLNEPDKKADDFRATECLNKTFYPENSNGELGMEHSTKTVSKSNTIIRAKFKDLGDGGLESDFNISTITNSINKVDDETVITLPMPTFKDLGDGGLETDITNFSISASAINSSKRFDFEEERIKFYILADTSYGSCCVDEIAAQHVDAQVIVHYGRSCLSPTTRLPVIYVFTSPPVDLDAVIKSFEEIFDDKNHNVILMADITFHNYVKLIQMRLEERGYTKLIAPETFHNPDSRIPNRLIVSEINLEEYSLFHLSEPPPALLLTLSSRVRDIYIYPTSTNSSSHKTVKATTTNLLRRRYALLNSLNTCSIFGVLINTLSVAYHLHALEKIQALINAAGKKYYTFVVGKLNAAKMANFSEIGGWVVIGCWESSLLDCKEFYRPVITPWELEWVLSSEKVRIWDGQWRGDFANIGKNFEKCTCKKDDVITSTEVDRKRISSGTSLSEDSESESEPPEFDLRMGRFVSNSRPMQKTTSKKSRAFSHSSEGLEACNALSQRTKGILTTIGGEVSPGAEFLLSHRTWTGLGCDFEENDTLKLEMDIGKSGVARGYVLNGKKT